MYVYDITDDITEKNMVILTPSMIFFLNQTKLNRKQIACLMFCLFELFVKGFLKV